MRGNRVDDISIDFSDIDALIQKGKNMSLVKEPSAIFKEEVVEEKKEPILYKSSDGKVIGTEKQESATNIKEDISLTTVTAKDIKTEKPQPKDAKVYKLYEISSTDTLKKVVTRFFEDYPATRNYYTESQLCNEIISTNGLRNSSGTLAGINFLTIPAYLPIEKKEIDLEKIKEEIEKLAEYQGHFVTIEERAIYQIVLNQRYTTDSEEIVRLVEQIKSVNKINTPTPHTTILIPNVQRYKLEQELKGYEMTEENESKQKINQ